MILADGSTARLNGRIELVFRRNRRGTSLAHSRVSAPLKIVRPFALDGARALVQVLTLGPGLCGGDSCTLDVLVEPGARAVVIMQAASRILGMGNNGMATQSVNLVVGAGALLEYYPGLTIPFADSCLTQRITVAAALDSRVGILESWAMGRTTRNEYLRFRHLSSRTVVSIGGRPAFADALEIAPAQMNAAATGALENHRYVASGFWYGVPENAALTPPTSRSLVAFDRCASPDQVFLRALADDGYDLGSTLQSAVNAINAAWGLEAIPLRRFVC